MTPPSTAIACGGSIQMKEIPTPFVPSYDYDLFVIGVASTLITLDWNLGTGQLALLNATMLGAAGYDASLAYATQRTQGRPLGAGGVLAAYFGGAMPDRRSGPVVADNSAIAERANTRAG